MVFPGAVTVGKLIVTPLDFTTTLSPAGVGIELCTDTQLENSEVLPRESVAVAVTICPAGTPTGIARLMALHCSRHQY